MREVRRREALGTLIAATLGGFGAAGCAVDRAHATSKPAAPGTLLWRFRTGAGGDQVSLAAADGMVYANGVAPPVHTGVTYGINATTGQETWRTHRSAIKLGYAAGAGAVFGFLASSKVTNTVAALDAATGRALWKYGMSQTLSALSCAGDIVYAQTPGPGLLALDARTGRRLWGLTELASQAIADDSTYVSHKNGATTGRLAALDGATGAERWQVNTSQVLQPLVVADNVVCGLADGQVYAFSSATGDPRWHTSLTGLEYPLVPAVADGTVFFVRDEVWALHARTGARAWTRGPARGQRLRALETDSGTLYLGMADGTLLALAAATGKTRWSQRLGSPVDRIVTAGKAVYAADANGVVHAFRT
jgi:outer membrane protein assembly factor BamB